MAAKKKKKISWARSPGKCHLQNDAFNGMISDSMSVADAHNSHPEFAFPDATDGARLFEARLKRECKQNAANKNVSARESAMLARGHLVFPKKTHDDNGDLIWETSKAKEHLIEDVKSGLCPATTPEHLHKTRPEHQEFTLEKF